MVLTHLFSSISFSSLQTVSQLVNVAGAQLKPHLPILLPALLEATGELESANLAYLSTRYGADADKQEMIDSVRAAVAKSHYSTETMTKVRITWKYKTKCMPLFTE